MEKGRVTWGYPVKSEKKAKKKLAEDLHIYALHVRHPKIVPKKHKDGNTWYHIEVDDI